MSNHLFRDLEGLKREILTMGAMVEEATNKAILAFIDRREDLAQEVIVGDDKIDAREVAIEEDCLKILALHQPVAADLRFIVAVMKVNNDLERVGDHAVNMAERAVFLSARPPIPVPVGFHSLVDRARVMLRDCLDAVVYQDTNLARAVLARDDEVDALHAQMYGALQDLMRRNPDNVERAVQTLSVSRCLERIADLTTNIAEDVVFMVEGEVIRHREPEFTSRKK